jgi:hypothetical protein
MIRVGTRKYTGSSFIDPSFENFISIIVLTKCTAYGDLGPYVIKDKKGRVFENVWQFSKLYEKVPATIQRYSRYDSKIIWEHKEEKHIDEKGNPTKEYWNWRKKGMYSEYGIRYPLGYGKQHSCITALYKVKTEKDENGKKTHFYECLNYIQARKQIYLKEYCKIVKKIEKFKKLKEMLNNGLNLLIIEVDGPRKESLPYYKEKYKVDDSFIENNTILITKPNMEIMLNDPKHPFGHGYCLALALLDWEDEFVNS